VFQTAEDYYGVIICIVEAAIEHIRPTGRFIQLGLKQLQLGITAVVGSAYACRGDVDLLDEVCQLYDALVETCLGRQLAMYCCNLIAVKGSV